MVGVPTGEFFTTDYTDCTDFFIFFSREFALFAVDLGSTMRNPKEPTLFYTGKGDRGSTARLGGKTALREDEVAGRSVISGILPQK